MDAQPLIVVRDVEASSRWYQKVLGLESAHGGTEYERLTPPGESEDGFVLQLHNRENAVEHPGLYDQERPPAANGLALWFRTGDFDDVLRRAEAAGADVYNGPLVNPNARHREIWLHDPDGYVVVVASRMGGVGQA
jgi:catechol 2,3-dioxygenase-like lactoylglutathione lyase family enzyme